MMSQVKVSPKVEQETKNLRAVQLMLVLYRDIYSGLMLAANVICVLVLETLCLYNSIDSIRKGISMFEGLNLVYLWGGCATGANVLISFGMLAQVHQSCERVYRELKSKWRFSTNAWFRRWIKSMPVLKIYFGGNNYFEVLTPPTMENFVVDQIVSLLLLN